VIVERRGTGASQLEVEDFSLERHVEDLAAVVDKVGLERFALFGAGDSGAVCLSYAAQYAERVARLVIWGAYARGAYWANQVGKPWESKAIRTYADTFRYNWPGAARLTSRHQRSWFTVRMTR
jgi:pimeloyl-ACP methyl ester carboxylesterase